MKIIAGYILTILIPAVSLENGFVTSLQRPEIANSLAFEGLGQVQFMNGVVDITKNVELPDYIFLKNKLKNLRAKFAQDVCTKIHQRFSNVKQQNKIVTLPGPANPDEAAEGCSRINGYLIS